MFNIDFVAFALQLGIDLIAAIGLVIYLACTFNWETDSPLDGEVEADYNDMRDRLAIKAEKAFLGDQETFGYTRMNNSESLL